METIRLMFTKPDPRAEMRKWTLSLRSQIRSLDRTIVSSNQAQAKAKLLIVQADKRGRRDPTRAKQAEKEAREMAREIVRIRREIERTVTIKAQVNSTLLKVQEAQAIRQVGESMRVGSRVMRQMSLLTKLPETRAEAMKFMMEYEKNAVAAEMTDEIMDDVLDDVLGDDEEVGVGEGEVDQILAEILKTGPAAQPQQKNLLKAVVPTPELLPAAPQATTADQEDEDEEDNEAIMDQMRNRLEALRG
ncbi:Vacuolar protein-sorting-associated protein 24 [Ceratocystis pirilliformis]|uniref:Vacuolar protein-sorting-associated protein 24 n=1 Tax=Ceratocystis pirilliformis TaxID=259994 RepID=A0ABR3ZN81_9PEZI